MASIARSKSSDFGVRITLHPQAVQRTRLGATCFAIQSTKSMAKHPKRRRRKMGRYLRGNIDEKMSLGTLAARTLVSNVFGDAVAERTYISSIRMAHTLSDLTLAADVGPILVGVAHSDYSAAEIEEVIENSGSWSEADLISREIGARKIRIIGIFQMPATGADSVLNDGKPITTKLGWILNAGQTLDQWAYNLGSGPLATTTPEYSIQGHANLWPR